MIDIVTGQVARINKDSLVVMVGGVGLHINIPKTVFDITETTGHTITLFTYLVVREDALTLYGFASEEERALFEMLISVSGIGPKLGLAVLSTLSADHLRNAVGREDASILMRVPGIGKKTAEKIVFELKGKMGTGLPTALSPLSDVDSDVLATLTTLGYSVVEAQSAIQSIPRDAPKDVESRVMIALQYFA